MSNLFIYLFCKYLVSTASLSMAEQQTTSKLSSSNKNHILHDFVYGLGLRWMVILLALPGVSDEFAVK